MIVTSTQPRVSIILPVYGNRDIKLTLDSVASQNFSDFECLVIEDGSNNHDYLNRLSTIRNYDSRFRAIRYEENRGAAYAREYGIMHSKGDIVAFIDSDDTWSSKYLCTVIKLHDQYLEFPIVATGYTYPNSYRGTSGDSPVTTIRLCTPFQLCFQSLFSCPTCSIKRSMIRIGFPVHLRLAEDLYFFFGNLIASRMNMIYNDEPLVFLNRQPGSPGGLSSDHSAMHFSAFVVFIRLAGISLNSQPLLIPLLLLRSFRSLCLVLFS